MKDLSTFDYLSFYMAYTADFNRSIAQLFTTPVFKEIVQTGRSEYMFSRLKRFNTELSCENGMEVGRFIETAYDYLRKNYRIEYLYKNTIANKILLGRHNLKTATLLNELKVGRSIADIVIVNGTSTVYEIKTELDSPEKIEKQIDDYKKMFARIFIVTHHTLVNRYLKLIGNSSVGLMALSNRFSFRMVKDADVDFSHLDNEVILKSLRKEEYSEIIKKYFGSIPDVSNIRFFKTCLSLAKNIEPIIFYELMLAELAKRKPSCNWSQFSVVPSELRHICLCLDPDQFQFQNLISFLNCRL